MKYICENCSTTFERIPSQAAKSAHLFCSRSCSVTFHNRLKPKRKKVKPIKLKRPKTDWSKVTLKELQDKRSHQANSRVRELARQVLKKYIREDQPCHRCDYSLRTEVCHKQGIATFPSDTPISVINHPDNLIRLCPNCHWEFDNGYLTMEEIQGKAVWRTLDHIIQTGSTEPIIIPIANPQEIPSIVSLLVS